MTNTKCNTVSSALVCIENISNEVLSKCLSHLGALQAGLRGSAGARGVLIHIPL